MTLIAVMVCMMSCGNSQTSSGQNKPEINVTTSVSPSDGLDVKLVGALIQEGKCNNAEELEKEINKEGGINNLDLDNDGKTDYVNVTENDPKGSTTARSFDLTTGKEGNITHIATVEVEKVGDSYQVHMSGNEQIYGPNYNHTMQCGPTFGQMLFAAWLFHPRPLFYHPFYYPGFYPHYYGAGYMRPMVVSRAAYNSRTSTQRTTVTKTVTKSSPNRTSSVKSSNAGKVSPSARTSINNNNKSQKSFQKRDANKQVQKGGFTKNSNANRNSLGSNVRKSNSSSGSSVNKSSGGGGSRRSFGGGGGGRRRCDATFKQDIKPLVYKGDIFKLKPVTFFYKDTQTYGAGKQIGFIAQDVQKVIPEAVYKDGQGLMLDYEMLIPILVQQVQIQQAQIAKLQAELNKINKN